MINQKIIINGRVGRVDYDGTFSKVASVDSPNLRNESLECTHREILSSKDVCMCIQIRKEKRRK